MFDFLCYNPIDSYMPDLPKQEPVSFIRCLNAFSGIKKADLHMNGRPLFKGIGFRKFTPYIPFPSGQYKINIYPQGKASHLIAGAVFELLPGYIYTAAISGIAGAAVVGAPDAEIMLITDYKEGRLSDMANVRLVQLNPNVRELYLESSEGSRLFNHIQYKHVSEYIPLTPGKHTFKGVLADTENKIFTLQDVQLEAGWSYTIYNIFVPGKPAVTPLLLIDGSTYITLPPLSI